MHLLFMVAIEKKMPGKKDNVGILNKLTMQKLDLVNKTLADTLYINLFLAQSSCP